MGVISPRRIRSLIVTHAIAAVLGYGAWRVIGWEDMLRGPDILTAEEKKPLRVRRDRGDGGLQRDSDEERLQRGMVLLADLERDFAEVVEREDLTFWKQPEKLCRLADSLPPVADAKAEVLRLQKAYEDDPAGLDGSEIQARYLLWLRDDTVAALAHLGRASSGYDPFVSDDPFANVSSDTPIGLFSGPSSDAALSALVHERGWKAMLDYREKPGFAVLKESILRDFAREGDISLLQELIVRPMGDIQVALDDMAPEWPMAKAEDFLKVAGAKALLNFAEAHDDAGVNWLMGKLNSPDMDPTLIDELAGSEEYKRMLRTARGAALEKRMAALAPDGTEGEKYRNLLANDISGLLYDGPDLSYAFRHGAMTAEQVADAVSRRIPELAAAAPDELRKVLYVSLAREDAQAAMALLANLPERERWEVALGPDQYNLGGDDPGKMITFLREMPPEIGDSLWERRLTAWERAKWDASRGGAGFIKWLEQQAPGPDREMAAYQVLLAQQPKPGWGASDHAWIEKAEIDAATARRLRSVISDPRLLERLDKKPEGKQE